MVKHKKAPHRCGAFCHFTDWTPACAGERKGHVSESRDRVAAGPSCWGVERQALTPTLKLRAAVLGSPPDILRASPRMRERGLVDGSRE